MVDLIEHLSRYFRDSLGVPVKPVPWADAGRLPPFLQGMYACYKAGIMGVGVLFMADLDPHEKSPAIIGKHIGLVRKVFGGDVIFVRMQVTAYNRKRLIEHNIPFIAPGNQMYLPMLGIDLRERYRRLAQKTVAFSPATQVLMLHILLKENPGQVFAPAAMAGRLGYSPMTLTRAFDEIESAGLGRMTKKGRHRMLELGASAGSIWEKARSFMRNPVKARVFIEAKDAGVFKCQAGLSALAAYSDLAPPDHPVFAAGAGEWSDARDKKRIAELAFPEPGTVEVEIWSYSPGHVSDRNIADPLSVYLTLKDDPDERIDAALDQMLKGLAW
ncbi:MAG: hypothetical protein ABIF71_07720 [Planctomycetota bacterium]